MGCSPQWSFLLGLCFVSLRQRVACSATVNKRVIVVEGSYPKFVARVYDLFSCGEGIKERLPAVPLLC